MIKTTGTRILLATACAALMSAGCQTRDQELRQSQVVTYEPESHKEVRNDRVEDFYWVMPGRTMPDMKASVAVFSITSGDRARISYKLYPLEIRGITRACAWSHIDQALYSVITTRNVDPDRAIIVTVTQDGGVKELASIPREKTANYDRVVLADKAIWIACEQGLKEYRFDNTVGKSIDFTEINYEFGVMRYGDEFVVQRHDGFLVALSSRGARPLATPAYKILEPYFIQSHVLVGAIPHSMGGAKLVTISLAPGYEPEAKAILNQVSPERFPKEVLWIANSPVSIGGTEKPKQFYLSGVPGMRGSPLWSASGCGYSSHGAQIPRDYFR